MASATVMSSSGTEDLSSQIRNRTSSMSQRTSTVSKAQHNFHTTTFGKPTYCDFCSQFIWGLVKQGHSCADCGYNAHTKCVTQISTPCCPNTAGSPLSHGSRNGSSSNLSGSTVPASSPSAGEVKGKSERDLVTELFAETQVQSKKLGNALVEANPALSIGLFLANNQRYTNRQLPAIWLNETLIKLLTWDSMPNTLIFLLCYTIVCLKPILVPILPQILLLYLMAKFYHNRADCLMNGAPLPKPHNIGDSPKITLSFAENKAALQNIQNTMGQISDIYDAGFNLYKMIDWSNPELTKSVLIQVLGSMVAVTIIVSIVPINILFLFGGVGAFVANTALFKAISTTIAPALMKKLQRRVVKVGNMILTDGASKKDGNGDTTVEVILFENQRWWANAGWVNSLLATERKAWTDQTGMVTLASKEEYALPTIEDFTDLDTSLPGNSGTFQWMDEWQVDRSWTSTDGEGWEYYNQRWENARAARVMGSYTRSRKWFRNMKLVEVAATPAIAEKKAQ